MDTPEIITNEQDAVKAAECCPKFHPEKWDGKTFLWDKKPFIKESIPEFFHIPYPPMIAKKVIKMSAMAEKANKLSEDREEILLLFMDPHPFRSDMFLSVVGEVPEANNITLTGTFMTKVYDGDFKSVPTFMKDMDEYLAQHNKEKKRYYVHYAYCPKCAEREDHNYMVFFAEIDENLP